MTHRLNILMRYIELSLYESIDLNSASEEEQIAAVKQNGFTLSKISNPSEQVQIAAVNKHPSVISSIGNPSKAVQLAAVQQDGWAIDYIENPSIAVQRAAANQAKDSVISHYNITSKDSALIELLTRIKSDELEDDMILYYVLRHTYPDWPEWPAIDKSLRASKLINESETVGYPASVIVNPVRRKAGNLAIHSGLLDLKYEGIGIGIQRKAIDPYAREISEYLDQVLSNDSTNSRVVSQAISLLAIGVRWPELQEVIEKHKVTILRYILTKIKSSIEDETYSGRFIAKNAIELLKEININWPEFDGILKSLDAM